MIKLLRLQNFKCFEDRLLSFRNLTMLSGLNSSGKVISPRMDKNGRIDNWPDAFFDEWDKSLEALLEPVGEG